MRWEKSHRTKLCCTWTGRVVCGVRGIIRDIGEACGGGGGNGAVAGAHRPPSLGGVCPDRRNRGPFWLTRVHVNEWTELELSQSVCLCIREVTCFISQPSKSCGCQLCRTGGGRCTRVGTQAEKPPMGFLR